MSSFDDELFRCDVNTIIMQCNLFFVYDVRVSSDYRISDDILHHYYTLSVISHTIFGMIS